MTITYGHAGSCDQVDTQQREYIPYLHVNVSIGRA